MKSRKFKITFPEDVLGISMEMLVYAGRLKNGARPPRFVMLKIRVTDEKQFVTQNDELIL